ncbi:hypothetical protein [Spirillospora sp. CA-294931]|uniref:hypothetical protein n=1 Tax=Spirillospora sp. CA-294931 TaxID=3240042 RepID=UPI003D915016
MLLLLLAGAPTTVGLLLYGVRVLVRVCTARQGRDAVKAAAVLAWTAAIGMYTWGLLHLLFLDDAARAQECQAAVGAGNLAGYAPSFVPLHFGCRSDDGHVVQIAVPPYVNLSVAMFGVFALVLTGYLLVCRKEEKE